MLDWVRVAEDFPPSSCYARSFAEYDGVLAGRALGFAAFVRRSLFFFIACSILSGL